MRRAPSLRWLAAAMLLLGAGLTSCGDDEGDLVAFCDLAAEQAQLGDVFSDLDPDDVETALETFRSVRAAQDRLRDVAPGAPRSDLDTVRAFVDDVIEGLEEADPSSPDPPEVYAELRPRFDEVEAASQRLSTYVRSNC